MSTSPSSNRSRHLRRLVGEQPCRSSSLLPHALPRTPGLHANGCLCSLHSAASDALCRSFPAAGAALPDAIQQVFRMFTGFFFADEMLHPAAERLNRESVLATINRAIHPALTPRLDVQRPIRAVCFSQDRDATGDPRMYERTRYGTTLHFQKVVQGSDAYMRRRTTALQIGLRETGAGG
jgi:hypothetical protein